MNNTMLLQACKERVSFKHAYSEQVLVTTHEQIHLAHKICLCERLSSGQHTFATNILLGHCCGIYV